mmetsp:Transcript_7352/g.13025  ORF Transcript_7352/g.13025 Transcript_7352/m.13025 type:complete len:340 (-) Transcript_7352:178-1197(-)
MWFIWDGRGILLALLIWLLFALTNWVIVAFVLVPWFWTPRPSFGWVPLTDFGLVLFVGYEFLIFISWYSHLAAATTDPGTVQTKLAPETVDHPKLCKICATWKPVRAHHCRTCQRCIFRMDHHCPWVNNCVGIDNQKLFILFLVYTAICAGVTLLFLAGSACYWLAIQKSWKDAATPSALSAICCGLVAVECLAAILFVTDFLWEQVESIQTNSTLVETYQRTHGKRTTVEDHFKAVFGHRQLLWLVPVVSAPRPDYTEAVLNEGNPDPWPSQFDDEGDLGIAGTESEGYVDSFAPQPPHPPPSGQTRQRRPGSMEPPGPPAARQVELQGTKEWRIGPG